MPARVQITFVRFSSPHAVARAQVLHETKALLGIIRRTTEKEGCWNGRRLSSAFAFAAVVASFVTSVGRPPLGNDGFGVQLAKDFVAVSFMALPANGSERRLGRLALVRR